MPLCDDVTILSYPGDFFEEKRKIHIGATATTRVTEKKEAKPSSHRHHRHTVGPLVVLMAGSRVTAVAECSMGPS